MRIVKVEKNNHSDQYNISNEIRTRSDLSFDESLSVAKRAQAALTVDALVRDGKKEALNLASVQKIFGVKQNFARAYTPSNNKSASSATKQTVSPRTLSQSVEETLATATGSSYASGVLTIPEEYQAIFREASEKFGVDEKFLASVAMAESGFNPNDVSSAGAQGIMQLMPGTAKAYNVTDPFDPYQNIMAGSNLLSDLLKRFNNNYALAAAGYNAGGNAVDRYDGIPPYKETQNYVVTVLDYYKNR